MESTVNGHVVRLLSQRALWIPESNALCIADTHFGKAATFRMGGLPVPSGTTASMLQTIDSLIKSTGAATLVVLGDWIHSSSLANRDYVDELLAWRESRASLQVILVRGNHDRHNRSLIQQFAFQLVDEGAMLGGIELRHFPLEQAKAHDKACLVLCGHLHPGCSLRVSPGLSKTFPCFVIQPNQIILPAFGEFTGLAKVRPLENQRFVACVENELIEIRSET